MLMDVSRPSTVSSLKRASWVSTSSVSPAAYSSASGPSPRPANDATASVGWSGSAADDITGAAVPATVGTACVEFQYVKARIRAATLRAVGTTTTVRPHLR